MFYMVTNIYMWIGPYILFYSSKDINLVYGNICIKEFIMMIIEETCISTCMILEGPRLPGKNCCQVIPTSATCERCAVRGPRDLVVDQRFSSIFLCNNMHLFFLNIQ